jgi:hypothetical protein
MRLPDSEAIYLKEKNCLSSSSSPTTIGKMPCEPHCQMSQMLWRSYFPWSERLITLVEYHALSFPDSWCSRSESQALTHWSRRGKAPPVAQSWALRHHHCRTNSLWSQRS